MRRVLNVGGGSKAIPIPGYYEGWEHVLLDVDPAQMPDVVCDARELATLPAGHYDAVYCAHNLEHYWRHDLPRVLAGFGHVLRDDGFAEIAVPDMKAVFTDMLQRGLDIDDVLYQAASGPITVNDVIYGWGRQIAASGNDFYAHKNGFTRESLAAALRRAGFAWVLVGAGPYEVRALAFKQAPTPEQKALLGLDP
ncbi:MAG: class I SAM-dependent methyltransferase [Usitatibacter sp.]